MKKTRFIYVFMLLLALSCQLVAQSTKEYSKFEKYIRTNRPDKIEKFIGKGYNVDAANIDQKTPLMYCLQRNNSDLAKLFIDNGANITLSDKNGNSVLHYAVQHSKDYDLLSALIDNGADVNKPNSGLYTPLHFGVLYACPKVPFILVDKGAGPDAVTADNETILHIAIESACDSIFNFALDQNLDIEMLNREGNTPLLLALQFNHPAMAGKLINSGANVLVQNTNKETPVYLAALNNDDIIFDLLVSKNAILETEEIVEPPIYIAASHENKHIVEVLLRNGVKNPMQCSEHDVCFKTAFVYSIEAMLANEGDKAVLYSNSLNLYNLAREKYKESLNKLRAKNAARGLGDACLIVGGCLGGTYYGGGAMNYETDKLKYYKTRIEKCDEKIAEIENILSTQ